MKVRLLHPEVDLDLRSQLPWRISTLINDDLEMDRLYRAMGAGDNFLLETAKQVVPLAVVDPEVIGYRQQVLADCLANRAAVQQMYDVAAGVEGLELRRKVFLGGLGSRNSELILRRSVRVLELLVASLRQLCAVSSQYIDQFGSTGLRRLSNMLAEQLPDGYLTHVDEHLRELHMSRGVLFSAQIGHGNKGEDYLLHQPPRRGRWAGLTGIHNDGYEFVVDADDLADAEALSGLASRAINDVANTVTQSAEHVQRFFARLRTELGFYLGCLNLRDVLTKCLVPVCFPTPAPLGTLRFQCRGLCDIALSLTTGHQVTGNDVDADGKSLIIITGANAGGKSTFLRSVGTAQIMMQAGMFVAATEFSANVRDGVFTHFKREEDATLRHGKLDEELARMSEIVEYIGPTSLLLCNESFAATNAREGSEIARATMQAMVDSGVRVFFVTHLYELANSLYARQNPADLFLRAGRLPDGARTFQLTPGEPEPTSYGEDCFRRIFGASLRMVPSE